MKTTFIFFMLLFFHGCYNVMPDGNTGGVVIKGKIEVQSRYFSDSVSKVNSVVRFNVFDAFREKPTSSFVVRIKNADSSFYLQKVVGSSYFQTEIPPGHYDIMVGIVKSQESLTNFETRANEIINIYAEIGGSAVY